MSSAIGDLIKTTVFGESHGPAIGAVMDAPPAGYAIDFESVLTQMRRRAPGQDPTATSRKETDVPEFLSGLNNGITTGAPLAAIIRNSDQRSKNYDNIAACPRPSHADYPAMVKYGDSFDIRGGGQFSGRLTAPICIAGAIALKLLEDKGIKIACHIKSVGNISDTSFDTLENQDELMDKLNTMSFAVIDEQKGVEMHDLIKNAFNNCDSVGGVIECKITGMPVAVGNPMFDGIENAISRMIFGIPAVKGIEFGAGFEGSSLFGSQYNDAYYYDENGIVRTKTNNAGGIVGGMSTGMPIIFRVAMKPTPSIAQKQDTVNLKTKQNDTIEIHGRHDPCIVPRANVVIRAATALAILDLLMSETSEV